MTNKYKKYNVAQNRVSRRCNKPANMAKSNSEPVTDVTLENSYR